MKPTPLAPTHPSGPARSHWGPQATVYPPARRLPGQTGTDRRTGVGGGGGSGRGSPKSKRAAQKRASPLEGGLSGEGSPWQRPRWGCPGLPGSPRPAGTPPRPRSRQPRAGHPGPHVPPPPPLLLGNFPAGGARGTRNMAPARSEALLGEGGRKKRGTPKNRGRGGGGGRRGAGVPAPAAGGARVQAEGGPSPAAIKALGRPGGSCWEGWLVRGWAARNLAKLLTSQFRCLFPQLLEFPFSRCRVIALPCSPSP